MTRQQLRDNGSKIDLNDKFDLYEIQMNDYVGKDNELYINDALEDMKRVMVYTNSPLAYYIKQICETTMKLEVMCSADAEKILKEIIIGEEVKNVPTGKNSFKVLKNPVTLYDVFTGNSGKNKLEFLVRAVRFISTEPGVLSLFRGYPYKSLKTCDMKLIQPWLDHVSNVISNHNKEIYEYLLNWISFIVQNPGEKTGVMPILISDQGAGKNEFFSNIICELLGSYALPNLNDIEKITGRFNTTIENKTLIICNELHSIENKKKMDSNAMKSPITDKSIVYEEKYMRAREGENVANFLGISNNAFSILLDQSNRRFLMIKCSDEMVGNIDYFEYLDRTFTKPFYTNLFTYFMQRDISKWNRRNIPETELGNDLKEVVKESWLDFFEENVDYFYDNGWHCGDCYQEYENFCSENGIVRPYVNSKKLLGMKLKSVCYVRESKEINQNGRRSSVRYYCIKPELSKKYPRNEIVDDPDSKLDEAVVSNSNEITDSEIDAFINSDNCGTNMIESMALFIKRYHSCSLKEFNEKIGSLIF